MKLINKYKSFDPFCYIEIFKKPDWYLVINDLLKEYFYDRYNDKSEKSESWYCFRQEFLLLVEECLDLDLISLGAEIYGFDSEREKIDTVVIHHSGKTYADPISKFNALQLINLYCREFSNPKDKFYGKPISSDHFYKNKPTFIGYHYIIFPDGRYEQVLKDESIGWHCGNWSFNKKSVGICFHDDLADKRPSEKALVCAKEIVKKYNPKEVFGHCEILPTTICPGNKFLGENGWKAEFLDLA